MKIFIKDISHIKDRHAKRTFAHAFLNEILLQKTGHGLEVVRPKNKKPYIKNNPFFFNMSHSHNMVAIAVADFEVGIDIEYMKERNFAALSLHHFGKIVDNAKDFYQLWTEFEASVKLYGGGVFNYTDQKPKHIYSKQIGCYMLSIASDNYFTCKMSSLDSDATCEKI